MRKIRVARFKLYNDDVYSINHETILDMEYISKKDLNFNNIFKGKKVNKTNLLNVISNNLKEDEYINNDWTGTILVRCVDFHNIFGDNVDVLDIDISNNKPSLDIGYDLIPKLTTRKGYMKSEIFSFFKRCENCGATIFIPIECFKIENMRDMCSCNSDMTIEKVNEIKKTEKKKADDMMVARMIASEEREMATYCSKARILFEQHRITSPIEMAILNRLIVVDFIKVVPQYNVDNKYHIDIVVQDLNGRNLFGIECDGYEWHSTKEQMVNDYSRERYLKMRDIELVRFMGSEIHSELDSCVEYILQYANKKLNKLNGVDCK